MFPHFLLCNWVFKIKPLGKIFATEQTETCSCGVLNINEGQQLSPRCPRSVPTACATSPDQPKLYILPTLQLAMWKRFGHLSYLDLSQWSSFISSPDSKYTQVQILRHGTQAQGRAEYLPIPPYSKWAAGQRVFMSAVPSHAGGTVSAGMHVV